MRGGAYSDPEVQRREIAARLDRVAQLLRRADSCTAAVTIVDSMGAESIRVVRADGTAFERPTEDLEDASGFALLLASIAD